MTEKSELMLILKRRKQLLSKIEDRDDENDDVCVNSEDTSDKQSVNSEQDGSSDNDPFHEEVEVRRDNVNNADDSSGQAGGEDSPEEEPVNLRRNTLFNLSNCLPHNNRDSYGSVNSRLSALSDSLRSSFSSNYSDGEIAKRNAIKLKAKDSMLINSSKQRRRLVHRNNSAPANSSRPANSSFLWSRGVSTVEQSKNDSTASVDSNSSELIYYSVDDLGDDSDEEVSISLDNVHIYEHERNKDEAENAEGLSKSLSADNIYEPVDYESTLIEDNGECEGSDSNNNDYSSLIFDNNKDTVYESDSDEFGGEKYNSYLNSNKLVSAINKNVVLGDGSVIEVPIFLKDESDEDQPDVVDDDKYDTATITSDEYGSDHYEEVESGLKVVSAVNGCFQNEDVLFQEIPSDTNLDKYQRRLQGRVNELVQTELAYVSKLDHVVNDYLAVLKADVDSIPLSLAALVPDHVFSNIEELRDFHKEMFLPALQEAEHSLVAVGKAFRDYEIQFRMYIRYSRDNKKCIKNVIEHKHFFNLRQNELGSRLDLSSYLLEPIQRVPRYKLFLDDLIKTCQKRDEEMREDSGIGIGCRSSIASYGSSTFYDSINFEEEPPPKEETCLESLLAAKSMVDKLLRRVDDTVAIENIKGCPVNLREQGDLLRQDEFTVVDNTKKRSHMRCFLFEYMLVFTAINRKQLQDEVFEYHDCIEMKDLGLTPPPEDECHSTFSVWYKKRTNKPYVMDSDINVKKTWVKDISALLWEQARRDKEKLIRNASRKSSVLSNISNRMSMEAPSSPESDFVVVPAPEPAATISVPVSLPGEQYSSLRGVPGEVNKYRRRCKRTTWYVD